MANRVSLKKGVFGASAVLALALLVIVNPVTATAIPLSPNSGNGPNLSAIGLPPSPPPPPPVGEKIVLTSTSGSFWELGGPQTVSGVASGTMTLTVIPNVTANPVNGYTLSVSGWVTLGTTNPPISINIPFTGGIAQLNNYETFIVGSGTVNGGTFTFTAFSLAPSVIPTHPLDFGVLLIHLHLGDSYYYVLLHVKTTVILPNA